MKMRNQTCAVVVIASLIALVLIESINGCPCKQCECVNCVNYEASCTAAEIWNTENIQVQPTTPPEPPKPTQLDHALSEIEHLKLALKTIEIRLEEESQQAENYRNQLDANDRANTLMNLIISIIILDGFVRLMMRPIVIFVLRKCDCRNTIADLMYADKALQIICVIVMPVSTMCSIVYDHVAPPCFIRHEKSILMNRIQHLEDLEFVRDRFGVWKKLGSWCGAGNSSLLQRESQIPLMQYADVHTYETLVQQ